jgi:hypothetical protein
VSDDRQPAEYEKPHIEVVGSIRDLTLTTFKDFTGDDGFQIIQGPVLGPVS